MKLDERDLLTAWRARDALAGRHVTWGQGAGTARGIDDAGRLVVELDGGGGAALESGEVHLGPIRPRGGN